MARVDELTGQIQDGRLRRELEAAISELRKRQRFGLVFEDHVPELAALHGLPLSEGSMVQDRRDQTGRLLRITALNGRDAQVESLVGSGGSAKETVKTRDLLVVKRFGDPIYPVLRPLGEVRRSATRPTHAVINGENYHTLQLLLYLYRGQVDCIYIDPPYNTGARDWKYNNRYVDAKDEWRHSKWLSMMERRLRLSKRLLRQDGVLIVTVDEHEVHHLGMLLERIFPDYLRHMVTIVINPKGTGKLNFARVDEYAIFCVPNRGASIIEGTPTEDEVEDEGSNASDPDDEELLLATKAGGADDGDEESSEEEGAEWSYPFPREEREQWELRHARRRGAESSYRRQRPNQFYPIFVDVEAQRVVKVGDSLPLGETPSFKPVRGLLPIWPIDDQNHDRCWRFVPETMRKLVAENRVVLGRKNRKRNTWTLNIWERRPAFRKLKTVWWDTAYDAGTHGTSLLYHLLGRRDVFPFPKSVYAVRDSLAAVVRSRPNALILDFFAGSGTTLHATALLNAADGGNRRCVLVSNNEVSEKTAKRLYKEGNYPGDSTFEKNGVFEQATRPRCEAVISGRRPDGKPIPGVDRDGRPFAAGLEENVAFFRLDYLDPDSVELGDQFEAILPLLWLGAGGREAQPKSPSEGVPWLIAGAQGFAVLLRESRFGAFRGAIAEERGITHVHLVTDSEEAFADMRSELPGNTRVSMLYRDYLRSFRINTERNL